MLAAGAAGGAPEQSDSVPHLGAAVEQARKSVVLVTSACADGDRETTCSVHTGFFVNRRGGIVTSIYAVAGCASAEVRTTDGRTASAEVVAVEQASGLVLLETDLEDTSPLQMAEDAPRPGDWIVNAVAQPAGGAAPPVAYGLGRVSSVKGTVRLWGVEWQDLIVISIPVSKGAASAPLLDPSGRLVGVVLACAHRPGQGCACYGLPAARVKESLNVLRSGGRRLGWLGLTLREAPQSRGAVVGAVLEGFPAHSAGIRPGDVLLAVDGRDITGPSVLAQQVVNTEPGQTLRMTLRRNREVRTVPVTVGPRPLLIARRRGDGGLEPTAVLGGRGAPGNRAAAREHGSPRALEDLRTENQLLQERIRRLEREITRLRKREKR